jgi:cyclopropane fatty-acyl-phospholipid synthase-like methyltransferase
VTTPQDIVQRGYDAMAERYGSWRKQIQGSPAKAWLEDLAGRLDDGSPVLDLGCGNGEPAGRILAPNHRYTGVDISREQLVRARAALPAAELVHADLTKLEFEAGSFQAVVSVYVFNHVPRSELPPLLGRIEQWLRPGGYMLASFGCSGAEVVEGDWLGVPMFFASYTEAETLARVREAGLVLERHEVVPIVEPEGEARFLWTLARKPPGRSGGSQSREGAD